MNHLWGSKCHKVSKVSSQKILNQINKFYGANLSKETDVLTFSKTQRTFDPYFQRAILDSGFLIVPKLSFLIYLAKNHQTSKYSTEQSF